MDGVDRLQAGIREITRVAEAAFIGRAAAAGIADATAIADEVIARLDQHMPHARYGSLPDAALEQERRLPATAGLVMARLLATLPERVASRNVPAQILPEFLTEWRRIAAWLGQQPAVPVSFSNDADQKDLGLCLMETFPCVAQVVEKNSGIPRRTAAGLDWSSMLRFARRGKLAPFYEIHTHDRMLASFNKEGWDRCYLMVADLLRADPAGLGFIGVSWFYDPAVGRISPRLAYLRDVPLEGGAIFVRGETTEKDRLLATSKSETRREAAARGDYVPTGYFMIWERDRLLAWADRQAESAR